MADLVRDDDVLHARVVLNDAALMTGPGRILIADWLRGQADKLVADGHNYAGRYSATYRTPTFTAAAKKTT